MSQPDQPRGCWIMDIITINHAADERGARLSELPLGASLQTVLPDFLVSVVVINAESFGY